MFTSSNTSVTPFSHLPSYFYNHSPPPLPPPPPPPPHFSVEDASHDGFSYPQFPNQDPFFSNTQMPIFTENKDQNRHRKICTSQGVIRDRRVRLSVDIARKFFDLQDMLGFDKASKTLEWLLIKSRKSIRKLSDPNHNIGGNTTNYSLRTSTSVVPENGDLEGMLNLPKNMSKPAGVSNTPYQSKMKKIMVNLGAKKSIRSRAREGIMPCYLKVDANQIEDVGVQIPRQESILSDTCFPNLPQNWDIIDAITGSGVYGEPAMGTHNSYEYHQEYILGDY